MADTRDLDGTPITKIPAQPLRPEERINSGALTGPEILSGDADILSPDLDVGEMNEADARESGYIGDDGKATH